MLSIRLNEQAEKELKAIARFEGITVSDFVRKTINEKLEELYGLSLYEEGARSWLDDPQSFTVEALIEEQK